MKDLERFLPDEDGRTLRGLATRLANEDDPYARELLLSLELGTEPRHVRKPEVGSSDREDLENVRRKRSTDV